MSADPYIRRGSVAEIVDGDTLKITLDLGFYLSMLTDVRLHGINAPEKTTPAGRASLARACELLPVGTMVTVQTFGVDKYGGRWQGAVTLPDGCDLATLLVNEHLAVAWDGHGTKPTGDHL